MRVQWNVVGAAGALLAVLMCASCATGSATPPAAAPATDTLRAGYARIARDRVTDAVSSISSEELETMRVARVEELLRGRMAGVQVERDATGELTIRIRNAGTLGRDNGEPLLVLDGMSMTGQRLSRVLDGISPGDIARIDVLKDAGATAPYGILGANGVILITTKRQRP
jgi:TonB-dependent SusC/RagA subfamily outer membrane receptor